MKYKTLIRRPYELFMIMIYIVITQTITRYLNSTEKGEEPQEA